MQKEEIKNTDVLSVQKKYNRSSKWGPGERRQDCLFAVRFHGPQIDSDQVGCKYQHETHVTVNPTVLRKGQRGEERAHLKQKTRRTTHKCHPLSRGGVSGLGSALVTRDAHTASEQASTRTTGKKQ